MQATDDCAVREVHGCEAQNDRELPLKQKVPEYFVDEPMNRVYHFKGKSTIVADQFSAD